MRAAVAQLSELWFREDISAGEKKDLLLRGRAGLSGKPEQGDRRPCGLGSVDISSSPNEEGNQVQEGHEVVSGFLET